MYLIAFTTLVPLLFIEPKKSAKLIFKNIFCNFSKTCSKCLQKRLNSLVTLNAHIPQNRPAREAPEHFKTTTHSKARCLAGSQSGPAKIITHATPLLSTKGNITLHVPKYYPKRKTIQHSKGPIASSTQTNCCSAPSTKCNSFKFLPRAPTNNINTILHTPDITYQQPFHIKKPKLKISLTRKTRVGPQPDSTANILNQLLNQKRPNTYLWPRTIVYTV